MSDFLTIKLEDITDNFDNLRIPLSSASRKKLKKEFRYYGAQGIVDYVDNYLFDGEYILIAEDGENLKSQKANVCNLVTGKFWVNNHAHIISANGNNNTRYIYYKLNQIDFSRYVTGSAQPKLTKDNLNRIELQIHKSTDQQNIAAVLSALDAKIELNNRINTELEAMAKTLYDYWFVQFDFPDANGKPYKSSGGKMVWNEELKREIPEGWNNSNILAVADLFGGGTPSKKKSEYWGGHIPFFTPTDTTSDVYQIVTEDYITTEGLSNCSSILFNVGTVFITARGSVGKLVITACEMAMNQSCYALKMKGDIGTAFLYFLTKELIHHLRVKSTGSVFDSIVTNDIIHTHLSIPPLTVIAKYSKIVEPFFNQIQLNTKQNMELASLRDWLLPMLMNGQVKVC